MSKEVVKLKKDDLPLKMSGHRLLVKIIKMDKTTKGGIIIADTIAERRDMAADKGVVVDIGQNCWKAFDDGTPWAFIGDEVLLKRYAGTVFTYEGEKYTVINDDEILAVINPNIDSSDIEI